MCCFVWALYLFSELTNQEFHHLESFHAWIMKWQHNIALQQVRDHANIFFSCILKIQNKVQSKINVQEKYDYKLAFWYSWGIWCIFSTLYLFEFIMQYFKMTETTWYSDGPADNYLGVHHLGGWDMVDGSKWLANICIPYATPCIIGLNDLKKFI